MSKYEKMHKPTGKKLKNILHLWRGVHVGFSGFASDENQVYPQTRTVSSLTPIWDWRVLADNMKPCLSFVTYVLPLKTASDLSELIRKS